MARGDISAAHDKINAYSLEKIGYIEQIIEQIIESRAKFPNYTVFATEVAERLSRLNIQKNPFTPSGLIRKGSKYRELILDGFSKCAESGSSVPAITSNVQEILQYKVALAQKSELLAEKEAIISNLLSERENLEDKLSKARRVLPKTPSSQNLAFFSYIADLIEYVSTKPFGPYKFEPEKGLLIHPIREASNFDKFPDGFLEFYLKRAKK